MLIQADARQIPLREGCVQCVVTSPPYWGLRTYGMDGQIGLEATPEAYVAELVAVFREVWRVLKGDGTVWLNLGDSYASQGGPEPAQTKWQVVGASDGQNGGRSRTPGSLKPKDLVGIPWRVAFALQADGWYLRSDIIWHKPNPMPESVTDRPTKSHEYLFLLTKSERYFYDADAIKEPASIDTHARYARGRRDSHKWADGGPGNQTIARSLKEVAARHPIPGVGPKALLAEVGNKQNPSFSAAVKDVVEDRNKRSVWTIPTEPYSGAHFATFPEALVEPCVLAGSRFGDSVYDPFSGSGTVLAVAERLGRHAVGTDLNPAYHELAKVRTAQRGFRFEA